MRKPFEKEYKLTQGFNDDCCRDAYKKFGLMGHNGQDYGLPTGTPVLAPHRGKVIEATLDPQGYGLYLKIENDIEGSVLAHLKEHRVGVSDQVNEGQLVAYSDNSGNSTGPHLHWGYYRIPRNRQNGFAGFIDQTPFLSQQSEDILKQRADAFVAVASELGKPADKDIIIAEIKHFKDLEDKLRQSNKALDDANAKLTTIQQDADNSKKKVDELTANNMSMQEALQRLTKESQSQADQLAKLELKVQELQAIQPVNKLSVTDLIKEIFSRFRR